MTRTHKQWWADIGISALAALLIILVSILPSHCQANRDRDVQIWGGTSGLASGTAFSFTDYMGTVTNQFEVLASGTAAGSQTLAIVGCMPSGTCSSTLASSSTVGSYLVSAVGGPYNYWKVTLSWTGGDATTAFRINRYGVPSISSGTSFTFLSSVSGTVPTAAPPGFELVGCQFNTSRPAPTNTQVLPCQSGNLGQLYTAVMPSSDAGTGLTSNAQTALTTSVNVKASAGNVYGFTAVNGAATICWLEIINSAGAGTLGTAVTFSVPLNPSGVNGGVTIFPPGSISLGTNATGIAVGVATTQGGNTACGTAAGVTLWFK